MPQFDTSVYCSQIFWLVVAFSLLYVFVYKFIIPNAREILNNRQFNIQDNISKANELALEVEKLDKYYNEEVAKISTEIDKQKKEKVNSLEAEFLTRKSKLEQDLRKLINQNIEDISLVAGEFRISKLEASIKLAASIIEKITGTKADMNLLKNIKVQ